MKINDNGTQREMNADEIALHEDWKISATNEAKLREEAAANKAKAKQAVLEKLGLTADEVAALLS